MAICIKNTTAMFIALLIIALLILFACSKEPVQKACNLVSDCPKETCQDGYEYNKFSCTGNKCVELMFFADPCLNHYVEDSGCASDSDCTTGGCSGQICGKRGIVEDAITTCEFKEEYQCLKQTSCSCINNKCAWRQPAAYLECMAKYR